ncbi:MAG: translesion error-prone DNA polymerase V autoproteolytic subunit [bacterium]|nr:translesion error-prone DNA polymerase V autoproteolytic subunit [bacterium]
MNTLNPQITFLQTDILRNIEVTYFEYPVPAGFPSPAMDYLEQKLDLKDYLINHPDSTFFVRVKGESMTGEGINDGDLLVVDKSIEATMGQIVIAEINGEFTVKKIDKIKGKLFLVAANDKFDPIPLNEDMDFLVWGVVTYAIHKT